MKIKEVRDFTEDEKQWMDTVTVNYVIAQSDGYQQGYKRAIRDFTEYIIDYWRGSDDGPQQSILDALVDLGAEHEKRRRVFDENVKRAGELGYVTHYRTSVYTDSGSFAPFSQQVYTKDFEAEDA